MTPEQLEIAVTQLNQLVPFLPEADRKFAQGLVDDYKKKGSLSYKQSFWVNRLIEKAKTGPKFVVKTPAPPMESPAPAVKPVLTGPVNVGGFEGVVALFTTAKEHLKNPKITLSLDGSKDGPKIKLSMAGKASKFAGSIFIKADDAYKTYYGRVSPSGEFTPSVYTNLGIQEQLTGLLGQLAQHPTQVAKSHGKLTGNCCFCNKSLFGEDGKSVAAGFGPICAKHYGLMHEYNMAVLKQPQTLQEAMEEEEQKLNTLAEKIQAPAFTTPTYSLAEMEAIQKAAAQKLGLHESIKTIVEADEATADAAAEAFHAAFSTKKFQEMEFNFKMKVLEHEQELLAKYTQLPSDHPAVQENLQELTAALPKCYFCEQTQEGMAISHGFPVCATCLTELGME